MLFTKYMKLFNFLNNMKMCVYSVVFIPIDFVLPFPYCDRLLISKIKNVIQIYNAVWAKPYNAFHKEHETIQLSE